MNQIKYELLARRLKKPIENWDKITSDVTAIYLGWLAEYRTSLGKDVIELVNNLYNEVWEQPEKIVFFRDNVIDISQLFPGVQSRIHNDRGYRIANQPGGLVITVDSVLSYIALREFGFDVRKPVNITEGATNLILTTKVLKLPCLFSILRSGVDRSKALQWLNQTVVTSGLRPLVYDQRDTKRASRKGVKRNVGARSNPKEMTDEERERFESLLWVARGGRFEPPEEKGGYYVITGDGRKVKIM